MQQRQLYWAQAETNAQQVNEAKRHIDDAAKALNNIPSGPLKDQSAQRLALFQGSPRPSSTSLNPSDPVLGLPAIRAAIVQRWYCRHGLFTATFNSSCRRGPDSA